MNEPLVWDASYAIAKALQATYPEINLEEVSLQMIYQWTLALPAFDDDPELANDEILTAIYIDWLEELLENNNLS
ncbi:MAG TPA: Fe-S cluster assembly protein IscX [Anaerolineales bacterium]|nr:Fe-S cluster assembly protein IscX [Anaerolineales bacterium]